VKEPGNREEGRAVRFEYKKIMGQNNDYWRFGGTRW